MLEKFNKSRAQETSNRLQGMRNEYTRLGKSIEVLNRELQDRCPHPDECVKKIDSLYKGKRSALKVDLYLCSLCNKTVKKDSRT